MGQLDELRKSLGMPPANDDDLGEIVAFLVLFELVAKTVTDQCETYPADERDNFMMTYAAYLKWFMMLCVTGTFPEETWQAVTPILAREFARQSWYRPETVESLYNEMVKFPPLEKTGAEFDVCLPWCDAIIAANSLGLKLTQSTDVRFHMYVIVVTKKLFEVMSNAKPA